MLCSLSACLYILLNLTLGHKINIIFQLIFLLGSSTRSIFKDVFQGFPLNTNTKYMLFQSLKQMQILKDRI